MNSLPPILLLSIPQTQDHRNWETVQLSSDACQQNQVQKQVDIVIDGRTSTYHVCVGESKPPVPSPSY